MHPEHINVLIVQMAGKEERRKFSSEHTISVRAPFTEALLETLRSSDRIFLYTKNFSGNVLTLTKARLDTYLTDGEVAEYYFVMTAPAIKKDHDQYIKLLEANGFKTTC